MARKARRNKFYELKIYRPERDSNDPEVIDNVDCVDIDDGGHARWKDPDTGLWEEVSGMPVSKKELPEAEFAASGEDDDQ